MPMIDDCPRCNKHVALTKHGVCQPCWATLSLKQRGQYPGTMGANNPSVIQRKQAERKLARQEGPEPKRSKPSLPRVKWLEREMP